MAKASGLDQRLFVAGRNLSGDVGSISTLGSPRGEQDVTGIDKSARERLLTLTDGQLGFTAFFNDAAGQAHPILSALPTTDVNVLYSFGSARAAAAAMLVGKQMNYDPTRASDGAVSIEVAAQANAIGLEYGKMLTAGHETVAATGNLASVDFGAAGTNGFAAMLHILEDGGGITAVNVQTSSDDGGADAFATVASFTITGDNTSERITLSGAVERYVRLNLTGSFTNCIIACAMRQGDANDVTAYS